MAKRTANEKYRKSKKGNNLTFSGGYVVLNQHKEILNSKGKFQKKCSKPMVFYTKDDVRFYVTEKISPGILNYRIETLRRIENG